MKVSRRLIPGTGGELPLNRDPARGGTVERTRARSYTSYGRILFKPSATALFGRLHVDVENSFIADQCELEGLWELARVTKLPVQYSSRTTTGTGISYLQMELAYRDGVLIPEQKAEPESPKHPDELLRADRGGLVFPPRLGFFTGVAELDFVSEFPSIMARFNVSPETVNCACCPEAPKVPELGYRICQRRCGITSRVVERLIEKRAAYKQRLSVAPVAAASYRRPPTGAPALQEDAASTERRANYKLRRSALKWLLVCCFGYTGYKNASFGKIEAHEAINALAREKLLAAKETAEACSVVIAQVVGNPLYSQQAREGWREPRLDIGPSVLYIQRGFGRSYKCRGVMLPRRFFKPDGRKAVMPKILSLLAVTFLFSAAPGRGQAPEGVPAASRSEIECSGFITSSSVPQDVYVFGGADNDFHQSFRQYTTGKFVYLHGSVRVGAEYRLVHPAMDSLFARSRLPIFGRSTWYPGQNRFIGSLGRAYEDVGRVKVAAVTARGAVAEVTFSCGPVSADDFAIPYQPREIPTYTPAPIDRFAPAPESKLKGYIVAAAGNNGALARGSVAYLSLGESDGARAGQRYRVVHVNHETLGGPGRSHGNPPSETIGQMVILFAEGKSSVAIVVSTVRDISLGDGVVPE